MASATNSAHPHPSPAIISDALMAYQRTAALRSGIELGIFRFIGEGARTAKALAERCASSERGIRILCDFLTINGFLEKAGEEYGNAPVSAAFLDPQSPMCVASISRFLTDPLILRTYEDLTTIVRNGRTSLPGEGSVEPDNPIWVEFAESMAPMMAPMAPHLASRSLEGMSGPLRVLDIAAGHGLFGIAVACQAPNATIVAQDWAAVLEVARKNAQAAGVADRVELLPGSAFDVNFGGPYDIVLLTNFLHHFDFQTCVVLLKKIRAAMRAGGRIATLEFVPNDDRVTPPMAAGFALTMLGSTPSGDAYTFRELEAMYKEAGFADAAAFTIPTGPNTIVTCLAV